jgi:D-3-phosphoglycerate dehydrogenase
MDMVPEGQMVIIENEDKPGVIGVVGTAFGQAQVNIADMVISRDVKSDGTAHALMVIKVDQTPSAKLIETLTARQHIVRVRSVTLPPR